MFEEQLAQKALWPIWQSIRPIFLGPGFQPYQCFTQWLHFLANLTNLTNLLSLNYRKTQLSVMSWRMDAVVPVLRGLVPGMMDERKFPLPPT